MCQDWLMYIAYYIFSYRQLNNAGVSEVELKTLIKYFYN